VNAISQIRLLLWATLAAAPCLAQQPGATLHGRVLAADSGTPLAGASLTFQPQEDHQVVLLRGWVGAGPRQIARTDANGRFRIPCGSAGCLLVQHEKRGLGAMVHHATPNSFRTVQARPMGELVLPGGADAVVHILAVSPAGQHTHLGQWSGPRIRLPEGGYRLLVNSRGGWTESRCLVVSARSQELPKAPPKRRILRLYDGFLGRITLQGWPRVALATTADKLRVPDGPGPRILQVWEEREGCVLLRQVWVQQRTQTLAASTRALQFLHVEDAHGKPVVGALCFSCYQSTGGLRIVSRSQSDGRGRAPIADVSKEPTGFVLVLKSGFALGHGEVFGTDDAIKVQLQPGHPLRMLVLGPRGDPQPRVEVQLQPVAAPWAARRSFTDPKGEVLFQDLPLGAARARLLGTPFLMEAHPVQVAETAKPAIIQARPGYEIRGRVLLPSGQPAANALVLLREARGSSRLTEKVVGTGPDGSFTLAGLPKELQLVLTASLERGGRTWTSRALRVSAGSLGLRVQLLAEDRPEPGKGNGPGDGKRDR